MSSNKKRIVRAIQERTGCSYMKCLQTLEAMQEQCDVEWKRRNSPGVGRHEVAIELVSAHLAKRAAK